MPQAIATLDKYQADFRRLTDDSAGTPGWLRELRQQAMLRFLALGFPTARKGNEPYKYTNVGPVADVEFTLAPTGTEPDLKALEAIAPRDPHWQRLVFIDGRYSAALSSATVASAGSLRSLAASDGALIQRYIGEHAKFQDDGFVALNTAFLEDGAVVHLPANTVLEAPLHVLHVSTAAAPDHAAYPRTLVIAEALSQATIIETYVSLGQARHFTDAVTEIVLADGALVQHYRLLLENKQSFHVGTTEVYQAGDSSFSSVSYAAGAALGRNNFRVLLDGAGSTCTLNGLYITSGTQHMDNNMNIDHAKPHATSRLYYKGILDDESRAVFGGMVLVRAGADKTDAHQQDKNLLLSDRAEVDSKPSLEIYADDVKCGHGATAGSVAEDALFYMMSRGLDPETAAGFLVKGFAAEILDTIGVRSLREQLEERTMLALPRFQHLEGGQPLYSSDPSVHA